MQVQWLFVSLSCARSATAHKWVFRRTVASARRIPGVVASSTMSPAPPRVLVVGAGFAGLAAARTLQASGKVEVVVLEASKRPGGRAWTAPLACPQVEGRLSLELGATWLHGLGTAEEPNPIFAEALAHGLMQPEPKVAEWWTSQWLLPGSPEPLDKEGALVAHKVTRAFAEAVEELEPDMEGSVADQLQATRQEVLGSLEEQHVGLAERAWHWRELLECAINGSYASSQISASGLALYDDMEGPFASIPTGYQSVAEALASGLDIRYNHEVERIEYGKRGVRVTCSGGDVFEGIATLVTVSLGVLKARHASLFSPALPSRTVEAIESLQIGVVDKLFVNLSPDAGRPGELAATPPAALAEEDDGDSSLGLVDTEDGVVSFALLWDVEASETDAAAEPLSSDQATAAADAASGLPAWVKGVFAFRLGGPEFKWQRPAAAAQQQESHRVDGGPQQVPAQQVPGQDPPAQRQPALPFAVMWITGEHALAMERSSDEQVLEAVRDMVRAFPALQRWLPSSWDVSAGARGGVVVRSQWGTDPHFYGSYSYIGLEADPRAVEMLLEPIWAEEKSGAGDLEGRTPADQGQQPWQGKGGVVLLCGEACHVKYIGCAHAAYMTGQQQAEWLLGHLVGLLAPQSA